MHEPQQDRLYFLRGCTMVGLGGRRSRNYVRTFAEAIPYRPIWLDDGFEQIELAGSRDTADFQRGCDHSSITRRIENIASSALVHFRNHMRSRIGYLQIATTLFFASFTAMHYGHHVSIGYSFAGVMMSLEILGHFMRHAHASK